MIFFVTLLRCIAACLITNAHYTGIYPSDIIANGGLLGDVLFFAVSGYCLCNVKDTTFVKWYGKRLWRVYPPVLLITIVYMGLGVYSMNGEGWGWWYIYPTYYHFVASIVVLYIPFYFLMKWSIVKNNLSYIMLVIAIASVIIYVMAYDKSYYHIDTVREPMIRLLFMESMLLGAWFRKNDKKLRNRHNIFQPIATIIVFILYFVSKVLFVRIPSLSQWQLSNWVVIFAVLYLIFRTFCGLDDKLEKLPIFLKKAITFISSMTLEIYVVQYVLIELIRPVGRFPLNWILLTVVIVLVAWILHLICKVFYSMCSILSVKVINKLKGN